MDGGVGGPDAVADDLGVTVEPATGSPLPTGTPVLLSRSPRRAPRAGRQPATVRAAEREPSAVVRRAGHVPPLGAAAVAGAQPWPGPAARVIGGVEAAAGGLVEQ